MAKGFSVSPKKLVYIPPCAVAIGAVYITQLTEWVKHPGILSQDRRVNTAGLGVQRLRRTGNSRGVRNKREVTSVNPPIAAIPQTNASIVMVRPPQKGGKKGR